MTENLPQKYDELMAQELNAMEKSIGVSFDARPQVINIIHANQRFELPDDTTPSKLSVIILGSVKFRSAYSGTGDDSVLLCSSLGCKVGKPTEDGIKQQEYLMAEQPLCFGCPYDAWESARQGSGKLCKEKRNMLIMTPDYDGAMLLRVPSTSIKNHDYLWTSAKGKQKPITSFITEISLQKNESGSMVWSTMRFEMGNDLGKEEFVQAVGVRKQFEEWMGHIEEEPLKPAKKVGISGNIDYTTKMINDAVVTEPDSIPENDDDLPF